LRDSLHRVQGDNYVKILHLSDLHFGLLSDGSSAHAFTNQKGKPDPSWLARLLTEHDQAHLGQPDAVVVSGDLSWAGSDADYKYVSKFLALLKSKWPTAMYVVTLGNHDVSWPISEKGGNAQVPAIRFLRRLYGPEEFGRLFALRKVISEERINRHDICSIHEGEKAIFVTANSSAEVRHNENGAYISPDTLMKLSKRLRKVDQKKLRILVMHHHLLPFVEVHGAPSFNPSTLPVPVPDPTTLANSAELQGWLAEHEFDVVLHGHRHVSHGRLDVLKTSASDQERRLIIVGAGSASVFQKELPPGQHHSFNVIRILQGQHRRWSVHLESRNIDRRTTARPSTGYIFREETGPQSAGMPNVFCGADWHGVHEAIGDRCWQNGFPKEITKASASKLPVLSNFVCIVEKAPDVSTDEKWSPPPTSRLQDRPLERDDIERAFAALHPEYAPSDQWRRTDKIIEALRDQHPRFHFQHGARLFWTEVGRGADTSPIYKAAKHMAVYKTRAFVSTIRHDVDVLENISEPMPSLTSVQFVQNRGAIDIVATFRNLELSYWWAVNVVELSRLLKWAVDKGGDHSLKVGQIVMMAPMADWKWAPVLPSSARLDDMELSSMSKLVKGVPGKKAIVRQLIELLSEKQNHISQYNLEHRGLEKLAGLLQANGSKVERIAGLLLRTVEDIRAGVRQESERLHYVQNAKKNLREALNSLGRIR
jgi:3',5'-cyclic AMP phosphodiesterase CpdA